MGVGANVMSAAVGAAVAAAAIGAALAAGAEVAGFRVAGDDGEFVGRGVADGVGLWVDVRAATDALATDVLRTGFAVGTAVRDDAAVLAGGEDDVAFSEAGAAQATSVSARQTPSARLTARPSPRDRAGGWTARAQSTAEGKES